MSLVLFYAVHQSTRNAQWPMSRKISPELNRMNGHELNLVPDDERFFTSSVRDRISGSDDG
ncbi:hypothetical protein BIW11_02443 [Tropilaelaps mercedesae]|uniref:Uncharacterized protein n=1 Tax=Tropilaelaps mercedesae TaxID=418985 RepID=A0A1V9Y3F8_9ACAR|nr:hypothetical protein BIW11_02443 [Tropilaelaps mercedesae]